MMSTPLMFPKAEAARLEPYLPPLSAGLVDSHADTLPFVTLTFATSLDSALSLGPGTRTAISGPQSKAMTHYLRSRHDAICVGVGTAIADDPGLNCRLLAAGITGSAAAAIPGGSCGRDDSSGIPTTACQPRPIVIDPQLRWNFASQSKVMQLARAGEGLAPYILTAVTEPPVDKRRLLEEHGGKFIILGLAQNRDQNSREGCRRFDWRAILTAVREEGLRSIMIEGGGAVINSLLSAENNELVDSVILTIAPTWLGQGGVVVSPPRPPGDGVQSGPVARLTDTTWLPLGEDVVLCSRIAK
ncbi:hypothetical protein DL762_001758 [Monosporascus cannonballus]|uniref:2,5-diamino-6-ribosylamino-4(3H)-pyrimidinone 5'-phosphate reductase n=1 Tax=Monosporascus cannonballus TaxID=155416 RepID=A0ABY0HGQ1_9PEZI|nr:hypothetical protein DL762_001758 [Monosporascus cannonballus]